MWMRCPECKTVLSSELENEELGQNIKCENCGVIIWVSEKEIIVVKPEPSFEYIEEIFKKTTTERR